MLTTALTISVLMACAATLTAATVTASVLAARGRRQRRNLARQQDQARANLAQFHADLNSSPGMRLTWKAPESVHAQEHAKALELIGTVDVETIDQDGRTQTRYSVSDGHAVIPVSSGMHIVASIDDIDKLDVYIIDGHVNSVNVTLTSGLSFGTANLAS